MDFLALNDDVKDALVNYPRIENFTEYSRLAIAVDNRLFEQKQEKKDSPGNASNKTAKQYNSKRPTHYSNKTNDTPGMDTDKKNGDDPDAMHVDATTGAKKITPAEKQRRISNNLCLYCGNEGHYSKQCPNKKVKFDLNGTTVDSKQKNW
jgi:hypothetical protein